MRQPVGQAADNTLNQRANSSRQRRAHSQQLIGLHRMLADVAAKHDQKGVAVCMSPAEFNFKVCCRSCFALGQCLPPAGATSSARPMTRLANDSSTFCHTQWIGDRWAGRGVQRLQTQQIRLTLLAPLRGASLEYLQTRYDSDSFGRLRRSPPK